MAIAIIIAILASFLWAISNHVDKFLISNIDENTSNIKTLLVFSTLVAGIVITPLWIILSKFNLTISIISLISVFAATLCFCIANTLYFIALDKNDTSIIAVMFQLIPVFSYILAFILFDESLTIKQTSGSIIIIISAIIIAIDFKEKNNHDKFECLIFMTLSSLFYAIYYITFDIAIRDSSYYSCAFWFQIGLLIIGIIFISIKSFREPFIKAIKTNGSKYLTLNGLNESLNLIANLMVNYVNLTLPIALVNVLNGLQGIFVFILGVIGTIFLPKYFKEDLSKGVVIQKVISIILGIVGLIILVV